MVLFERFDVLFSASVERPHVLNPWSSALTQFIGASLQNGDAGPTIGKRRELGRSRRTCFENAHSIHQVSINIDTPDIRYYAYG